MEKKINCAECGKEFTYTVPENYPDKRKYCTECSAAKKAQWDNKSNLPVMPSFPITDSEKVLGHTASGVPTGASHVPQRATFMSARDITIVAQTMMKAFYYGRCAKSHEEVYDTYQAFVKILEQNG